MLHEPGAVRERGCPVGSEYQIQVMADRVTAFLNDPRCSQTKNLMLSAAPLGRYVAINPDTWTRWLARSGDTSDDVEVRLSAARSVVEQVAVKRMIGREDLVELGRCGGSWTRS